MDRKGFAVVFAGQRDCVGSDSFRYYRMAEKNVTHAQARGHTGGDYLKLVRSGEEIVAGDTERADADTVEEGRD